MNYQINCFRNGQFCHYVVETNETNISKVREQVFEQTADIEDIHIMSVKIYEGKTADEFHCKETYYENT
jgi:hypothetical protein